LRWQLVIAMAVRSNGTKPGTAELLAAGTLSGIAELLASGAISGIAQLLESGTISGKSCASAKAKGAMTVLIKTKQNVVVSMVAVAAFVFISLLRQEIFV